MEQTMAVPELPKQRQSLREGNDEKQRAYSSLQLFFLVRLSRLLQLRQYYAGLAGHDTSELRLLDRAIFATYCDCIDTGVGEDARDLFSQRSTISKS